MKIEFMEPEPGQITPPMVQAMLALAGSQIALETISAWTRIELIVAFDWGAREHLIASDNNRIKRRDKPWFVRAAQPAEPVTAGPAEAELRERVHQILSRYPAGVSADTIMRDGLNESVQLERLFAGTIRDWLDRLESDGRAREFTPGLWIAIPGPLESEVTEYGH